MAEMHRLNTIRQTGVVDRTARLRERYEEIMLDVLNVQFDLAQHSEDDGIKATTARDIISGGARILGLERVHEEERVPVLEITTTVVNVKGSPGEHNPDQMKREVPIGIEQES